MKLARDILQSSQASTPVPADPYDSLLRHFRIGETLMKCLGSDRIHAVLFGLSEDLASELSTPLAAICGQIASVDSAPEQETLVAADATSQIIFCGADKSVVQKLRASNPDAAIVVVSRHAEVSDWLDSIEAGATDYCAAPFETSQLKWIVETSVRSFQTALAA